MAHLKQAVAIFAEVGEPGCSRGDLAGGNGQEASKNEKSDRGAGTRRGSGEDSA